jgi:PhnB protein
MAYHPYLFFGGSCREAFTRYQEIFGGELTLLTAADLPEEQRPPMDTGEQIMHAALVGGDGALLMGSDDPTTDSFGPVQGMQINFSTPDIDETKRVFTALAEGGTVNMEPEDTGWSPYFGMVADRFGTPWMVSADPAPVG